MSSISRLSRSSNSLKLCDNVDLLLLGVMFELTLPVRAELRRFFFSDCPRMNLTKNWRKLGMQAVNTPTYSSMSDQITLGIMATACVSFMERHTVLIRLWHIPVGFKGYFLNSKICVMR